MTAIERVLTNPPSDYTYHWHQIQTSRISYSKLLAKASTTLRLTKYSSASDTNQNTPTRPHPTPPPKKLPELVLKQYNIWQQHYHQEDVNQKIGNCDIFPLKCFHVPHNWITLQKRILFNLFTYSFSIVSPRFALSSNAAMKHISSQFFTFQFFTYTYKSDSIFTSFLMHLNLKFSCGKSLFNHIIFICHLFDNHLKKTIASIYQLLFNILIPEYFC